LPFFDKKYSFLYEFGFFSVKNFDVVCSVFSRFSTTVARFLFFNCHQTQNRG
jgi:hypothetical protein